MKWRIWKEKINLVKAIKKLDDNTLAKEPFNDQLEYELPGLVKEVKNIWSKLSIPDVTEHEVTKKEINNAIEIHLSKQHTFMKDMNVVQCAKAMRVKHFMMNCEGQIRLHYRGREECVKCRLSKGVQGPGLRETQEHLEVCEGYRSLRDGKDREVFEDKVIYFQEVMKERKKTIKRIRKARKRSVWWIFHCTNTPSQAIPKKICCYLDIVKIALTPPPCVLRHLRGTFCQEQKVPKKEGFNEIGRENV